jgi:hypothetical protein
MVHLFPPDGVCGTTCEGVIQTVAVSAGNDGGIVGRLGATLDLQAVQSHLTQIVQMIDHAHITGVQDVRTLLVLLNGEILAGALLLHEGVVIAAGLGTGAAVGVAAGHIVAQQAAAGIADAHGAMDKGLDLQLGRGVLPDGTVLGGLDPMVLKPVFPKV